MADEKQVLDRAGSGTNLAAGTYYFPQPSTAPTVATRYYFDMDGYQDIGCRIYVNETTGGANSLTLTFEGAQLITAFIDCSQAGYDVGTNTYGVASWAASGSTVDKQIDFDNELFRFFSIKVVVVGAAATNSVLIYTWRTSR